MTDHRADPSPDDARRALLLLDRPIVVDLVQLTLNHGLFVVRAASTFADAERILDTWSPHLAVVDMDHEQSSELLDLRAKYHRLIEAEEDADHAAALSETD